MQKKSVDTQLPLSEDSVTQETSEQTVSQEASSPESSQTLTPQDDSVVHSDQQEQQTIDDTIPLDNEDDDDNQPSENQNTDNHEPTTSQEPTASSSSMSILDAFGYQGTVRCTMTLQSLSSTLWVENESHLRIESAGAELESGVLGTSYLLLRDNLIYVWNDQVSSGISFSHDELSVSLTEQPVSADDLAQEATNVHCSAMTPPESVFEVPVSISFIDLSGI